MSLLVFPRSYIPRSYNTKPLNPPMHVPTGCQTSPDKVTLPSPVSVILKMLWAMRYVQPCYASQTYKGLSRQWEPTWSSRSAERNCSGFIGTNQGSALPDDVADRGDHREGSGWARTARAASRRWQFIRRPTFYHWKIWWLESGLSWYGQFSMGLGMLKQSGLGDGVSGGPYREEEEERKWFGFS